MLAEDAFVEIVPQPIKGLIHRLNDRLGVGRRRPMVNRVTTTRSARAITVMLATSRELIRSTSGRMSTNGDSDNEDCEVGRGLEAFRGKKQRARISFATPESLWKVLTAKRWDVLKAMAGQGPLTLRELRVESGAT